MRGDIDGDGKITENDRNRISEHLGGTITLTGADSWCAKVTGNNEISVSDLVQLVQYLEGKTNNLTGIPTFADYYNNWTYHKVDDLTGYWTAEVVINGLKTTSDAIVNISNDEGIFYKSELSDGAISFYATRPPIAEVPATITFKPGTGVITTSYESAKFHAATHSKDGADPIIPESIGALSLSGGTMTGSLILKDNPAKDLEAATKQYVDNHTSDTVLYTPQTLNDAQKAQARENIDAASTNELNAIPKPNLFINPLFQIWQLYPSGWSGVPVNRYVCDGWRVLSSDGGKQNNFRPASPYGMTNAAGGANCTFSQFLENAAQFNGQQMTCSVLKIDAGGTQSFVTATKTASGWTDSTDILAFFGTSSQWRWVNSGETLIGAKLEVGTQQTFVHKQANGTYVLNSVPTVAEQLAICNKYDPETGKLLGGWDHPPMQIGVEYRTTERFWGKPVYYKIVDCGKIADNKQVEHGIVNMRDCISFQGLRGGMPMPSISNNNLSDPWSFYVADVSRTKITLTCGTSAVGGNCHVMLKYTKTTD